MESDDPRARIDPERYYDEYGHDEWDRLERTKSTFEFQNTIDYLESYLPAEGHVLDAGGAAGRYAVWLAERGYRVTLADISGMQRELAREKARERDFDGSIEVLGGDIRDLPFVESTFDATLCLGGPLSHVIDDTERNGAMRELRRVTNPGSPVFVSVMGFIAVVQNLIKVAPEFPQGVAQLPDLVETGTYSPELLDRHGIEDPSFVECHFFRADELEAALERNGLKVECIAGLEGPASNFDAEIDAADGDQQERIEGVVRKLREDRTIADISNHILAVSRVR
ncbi:MAG TPA: class I SAM-dependent methyltransferase [Halococcus sp.]|nr:class I SAM-dependent methyltransferase [Halococcus sp.]